MSSDEDSNSKIELEIISSDRDVIKSPIQYVVQKEMRCKNVSSIHCYDNNFLLCGLTPLLLQNESSRRLHFLRGLHVLGIEKDAVWAMEENTVIVYDFEGMKIMSKTIPEEFLSVHWSAVTYNSAYICSDNGIFYVDVRRGDCVTAELTTIPGKFDRIIFSKFTDILVYGEGKAYLSLSSSKPNFEKQSFTYSVDKIIEMLWFDIFIAQLTDKRLDLLDNSGKMHHTHVLQDDSFLTCSAGDMWLSVLTAQGNVCVFDMEAKMHYRVTSPGDSWTKMRLFTAGMRNLCIVDGENVLSIIARTTSKHYMWVNEIYEWSRGVSSSLKNSLNLPKEVTEDLLVKSLPCWLNISPDQDACANFGLLCKRSPKLVNGFIACLKKWMEPRMQCASREFWSDVFSMTSEVLNHGIPACILRMIKTYRNVYAVAECAKYFSVDIFGDSDTISWIIVNQQEAVFREIIYKFIKSDRFGGDIVDIIAKTCSAFSPAIVSVHNNPYHLLTVDEIIESYKRGMCKEWIDVFRKFSAVASSRHMQCAFDNLCEHVAFKNEIDLVASCLLLAEPPTKLSICPTMKITLLRYLCENLSKQHHLIDNANIPRILKILSVNPLTKHGSSLTGNVCIGITSNSTGIFIATQRGVYTTPYVGLPGNLRKVSNIRAVCMASTFSKLAISGRQCGDNVLCIYNTETNYILFSWETKSIVMDMVFLDDVLFTIEENGSAIVYNPNTGRVEEVLRVPHPDNVDDSDSDEDAVRVMPHTYRFTSPTPIATQHAHVESPMPSPSNSISSFRTPHPPVLEPTPTPPEVQTTTILPPVSSDESNPTRATQKDRYNLFSQCISVIGPDCLLEVKGSRNYVWKKRGLSFSVRFFLKPENWITLCMGDEDEDGAVFTVYVYISKNGTIQMSNSPRVFTATRKQLITAACTFGKQYILTGSYDGRIVFFDVVKMKEIATYDIEGSPAIHDFEVDGCELYVATSSGTHVFFLLPWNQERVLDTIMETAARSKHWMKEVKKFPFNFQNLVPTVQFVHFVDMVTRGETSINSVWRSDTVVQALMAMYRKTETIASACVRRIVTAKQDRNQALFTCTICQSSTVNDTMDKRLYIIKNCLHRFHYRCLESLIDSQPEVNTFTMENWALETHLQCPVCRTPFQRADTMFDPISTKLCIYDSGTEDDDDSGSE